MRTFLYDDCPVEIRTDLRQAQQRCWDRLARPGTWLDAEHRLAIAAEIRHAGDCAFCQVQKKALSPNSVRGEHAGLGDLSAAEVEAIHRIVSDPGRLSRDWYTKIGDAGLSGEPYVEMVSIVAMVMMADTFALAMGLPVRPLPTSVEDGEPSRYRSPGAKVQAAWVPIIEPADISDSDGDLYASPKASYIHRALSSVPDSKRDYWDMGVAHYLPAEVVWEFDTDFRAISRMQIELIAAKTSALHQCLY